jgi:enterochelin esterase family protein
MSKIRAIDELIGCWGEPHRVRAFMGTHRFPLVEGHLVTFVYIGNVDAVNVRHWVYGLESSTTLTRAPGTDIWHLTLEIPPSARVEYKFEVQKGDRSEWIEDPLNRARARDPFGANSVLQGEGYVVPEWTRPDPLARQGNLEPFHLDSKAFRGRRGGHLYLPARFRRSRQYPLVVVHDGDDYIHYAEMVTVLNNLIHRLEIPEMIVAFISSSDRLREYADNETHARYVTEELLPYIGRHFPLIDQPHGRALVGASFGGVASFSTACRYPGVWGRLLLQSGSFAFTDIGKRNRRGPLFDRVVEFVNGYRAEPKAVSQRIYVSCGVYESLIYENRSLVPLLDATGMQVRFTEARDGHNWQNWRDRLREGLSWLFPGPLLFVYE